MISNFNGKVFVRIKNTSILLTILLSIASIAIIVPLLVKILVGDFHFKDILSMIVPAIIIYGYSMGGKKVEFSMSSGTINFGEKGFAITYKDVDGGKRYGKFSETTTILYDDVRSIEYSDSFSCYRIVAKCDRRRFLQKTNRESIMNDYNKVVDTYLYVYDEEEKEEMRKNLQKYVGYFIKVVDPKVEETNEFVKE